MRQQKIKYRYFVPLDNDVNVAYWKATETYGEKVFIQYMMKGQRKLVKSGYSTITGVLHNNLKAPIREISEAEFVLLFS